MKLTITLSTLEENNMRGWVNYLVANPQYIGVAGRMSASGVIDVQTRLVLEEQTRARFEEIAAQFGVTVPRPAPGMPGGSPGPAPIDQPGRTDPPSPTGPTGSTGPAEGGGGGKSGIISPA